MSPSDSNTTAGRKGVVLVVTLFALVALEAVALGIMRLAMQEQRVALAHDRHFRARLAAERGVIEALSAWRDNVTAVQEAGAPDDAAGAVRVSFTTVDGFSTEGELRPLASGQMLSSARAADALGTRYSAGLIFTPFDPVQLLPLFDAGVASPAEGATFGGIDVPGIIAALARAPDVVEQGNFHIGPVLLDGACAGGVAGNWGTPASQTHPCAAYQPIILVAAAARVLSGEGQGILVVTGRLVLGAGVHHAGAVLVSGELVLEPGASIAGSVVLAGGTLLGSDDQVAWDVAALQRLLEGAQLGRRLPATGYRWIPLF